MKHFAVIGKPIEHSLSPRIHSLFAEQTGIKLEYEKLLVEPTQLARDIDRFFSDGGSGLNVTIPHKQAVYAMCKTLTPRAQTAQAVNTLYLADDALEGDNTDGIGLVRDIQNNLSFDLNDKQVLILGAGGAARGIIEPLAQHGTATITIANRTHEKAVQLAESFAQIGTIKVQALDALRGAFDLVINATASSLDAGMPDLPAEVLSECALAYDLMYSAEPTPFMTFAKTAGSQQQSDGLGMLVEQAAEAFRIWNKAMPDTIAVIKHLR